MKKLSLLLFAFCLSVMGWALNPNTGWNRLNTYVYDMGASLTTNNDTVVLTYKLNSAAVPGGVDYDDINPSSGGTGRGIQIYLLYKDEQGEWQRVQKDDGTDDYAFYRGTFKQGDNTAKIPVAEIPTNCKGKELTWEARVHGNVMRTLPTIVGAVTTKPYNAYGIAVNNDPTHKRFAQMYVSEAYPRQYTGWNKYGEGDVYKYANQMLEYTPLLGFQCAHFKHWHDGNVSHFASTWNWTKTIENFTITCTHSHNYEPNRIKVSEDGRIFTSSFHPKASCAVVEYSRGDRDTYNLGHHFYSTIKNNWDYNDDLTNSDAIGSVDNPFLYRRCIGMDVKGKGENLKIILLWIDANACNYKNSNNATVQSAKFEIYEYEIGRAEKNGKSYLDPFDTASGYVHKIGEYDWDYKGATGGGAFYQGARYGVRNETAKTQLLYNNMSRGFADLAYGPNNDVWVKIDYCFSKNATAQIIRVKLSDGSTTPYTVAQNTTANYGGSGILIKGDLLITSPTDKTICMYQINANGELTATNNIPTAKYTITDDRIGTWVTGFATDFAGNLFSLTQAATNGENYTANVLGIAMPYKTAITTRAKGTFTVTDPIPNILATDLRYEPAGTKDEYTFSFYVNTKPSIAEIRFYKKESLGNMNSNIATIHADNYQKGQAGHETDNPDYVYTFPAEELKQGVMSVTFKMVGGDANSPTIIDALPPGELCWSVYVEAPRQSAAIAPIYREEVAFNFNVDGKRKRKHIVVNNYPETDLFGTIIAANYENQTTTNSTTGVIHQERGLLFYGINDQGIDDSATPPTENNSANNRYTLLPIKYLNGSTEDKSFLNYPRRMAVAPDGKIYIADEGATGLPENVTFHNKSDIWAHDYGGIKIWDPASPNKFSLFSHNQIKTSTGVALWNDKLYAANTYAEFVTHSDGVADSKVSNYTPANQKGKYGWNGFVEYTLNRYVQGGAWAEPDSIHHPLGQGDASGNFSIVAMEHGIWLCQHREHNVALKDAINQPLADNQEAICISFVPYNSNTRTWKSSWVNGKKGGTDESKRSLFSQTTTAPVQSTPGGGMAYRKVKVSDTEYNEYIYVPNHDGNIAEVRITSWANPGTANARPVLDTANVKIIETPSAVKGDHDVTGTTKKWHAAAITSMDFDYAGNLVLTIGPGNHNSSHALMIYTMPYNRTNAQEIRAPESCIYIPERLHQIGMDDDIQDILDKHSDSGGTCAIDLYRPLQGGMFNTICLPFELNLGSLPADHPLKNAKLQAYTELKLETVGGEKMLELVFTDVNDNIIRANTPYIIRPENDEGINHIIRFDGPLVFTNTKGNAVQKTEAGGTYSITYQGIIPYQYVEPKKLNGESLTMMLVADNRLALMTSGGNMLGFRGYFNLNTPLKGIKARITNSKGTTTNTTIVVDGKKVNVEKYLQEGRVYIRMGDSLYTITGEKVE